MRNQQGNLFGRKEKKRYSRTLHGGIPSKGRRKLERPLSTRKPIHPVLKSEKAKGKLSFLSLQNKPIVQKIIKEKAKRFGIRIADLANVGNHIHLKIHIQSREQFQRFLKSVTSLIARKITGARKGKPFGKFWDAPAFTRVLKSWTEELYLRGYFIGNRAEAEYSYEARVKFLREFNKWVYRQWRKEAPA